MMKKNVFVAILVIGALVVVVTTPFMEEVFAPGPSQVVTDSTTVSPGAQGSAIALCSPSTRLVTGGFSTSDISNDFKIAGNHPVKVSGQEGWKVILNNLAGSTKTVTAYALCGVGP